MVMARAHACFPADLNSSLWAVISCVETLLCPLQHLLSGTSAEYRLDVQTTAFLYQMLPINILKISLLPIPGARLMVNNKKRLISMTSYIM